VAGAETVAAAEDVESASTDGSSTTAVTRRSACETSWEMHQKISATMKGRRVAKGRGLPMKEA